MALNARLRSLLRREFATITLARQDQLRRALERAAAESVGRFMGNRLIDVEALDPALADEFQGRARAYLQRTLQRMSELGEPWTEARGDDARALLQERLSEDWNTIATIRENRAGPNAPQTGLLPEAKDVADREIAEELEMRVLRQERQQLPLADLLAPPRYDAVRVAWQAARRALDQSPSADDETVRQAIGAVEGLARLAANEPTKTLGDCLKVLGREKDDAGRRLLESIEKVYAYTNVVASGRHGGGPGDPPQPPEARYVLEVAEAAIRLLLVYDRAY